MMVRATDDSGSPENDRVGHPSADQVITDWPAFRSCGVVLGHRITYRKEPVHQFPGTSVDREGWSHRHASSQRVRWRNERSDGHPQVRQRGEAGDLVAVTDARNDVDAVRAKSVDVIFDDSILA